MITQPFHSSMVRCLLSSNRRRWSERHRENGEKGEEKKAGKSGEKRSERTRSSLREERNRGFQGVRRDEEKKTRKKEKEQTHVDPSECSEKKQEALFKEDLRCLLVDLDSAQFYYEDERIDKGMKKSNRKASVYPGGKDVQTVSLHKVISLLALPSSLLRISFFVSFLGGVIQLSFCFRSGVSCRDVSRLLEK